MNQPEMRRMGQYQMTSIDNAAEQQKPDPEQAAYLAWRALCRADFEVEEAKHRLELAKEALEEAEGKHAVIDYHAFGCAIEADRAAQ
jgi:hypothetical protein